MKAFPKFIIIVSIILFSGHFLYSHPALHSYQGTNIEGIWQGALKFNGNSLRIVFRISKNESGKLKAEMDSPDQGVKGIRVDTVIINGDSIKLELNIASAYYEGKYNSDSLSLEGNWHQSGLALPLVLKKVDKIDEVKRSQEPKPPFPYKSEDVVYENKAAGIKLGGTLTVPESGGPFAAVILITGSGQQNRDGELAGHKPFLVLADYLTRKGIAVLRVDDRGIGESTGDFAACTYMDFVSDVIASIKYLKGRKEIDKKRIGLIGHSEGGMIAPIVAAQTKDVAFIVLMAGPGIPCDQLLFLQSAAISKAAGFSEEKIKQSLDLNKRIYTVIKTGTDSLSIVKELRKIFDEIHAPGKSNPDAAFAKELKIVMTPWFRYFIGYDPAPALEKVKCPVLALNGSKDMQVLPDEDLAGIKKALDNGGNKNYEIKKLEGLNHLFQTAETGNPAEYMKIEETIAPAALQIIGDWILKVTKK